MLHKYSLEIVRRAFSKLIKITEKHFSRELQHSHKSRRHRKEILVYKQICQVVISGFRLDVDELCPLMGYDAALSGSSLPKLRNIGPIFQGQNDFLTLEDGKNQFRYRPGVAHRLPGSYGSQIS